MFAPQNKCIDDTVNRYLIDGDLPGTDTACPVMPSPTES
ncbi:alpha/beta hydrolase [Streptomyces sp. NPDC005907]